MIDINQRQKQHVLGSIIIKICYDNVWYNILIKQNQLHLTERNKFNEK